MPAAPVVMFTCALCALTDYSVIEIERHTALLEPPSGLLGTVDVTHIALTRHYITGMRKKFAV